MINSIKTTILLSALTLLLVLIGQYLAGYQGMVLAFILALVINFGSYWFSDKIVLSMYKAKEVDLNKFPVLYRIINRLTQRAGLPKPKVYIINSSSPNAFATGRNPANAAIAVTEGILNLLSEDELEGVIAHELAHIKDRDILISSIAATLAGVIMMIASMARWMALFGGFGGDDNNNRGGNVFGFLLMAILAPLAATLIQLAISRSREYLADEMGAYFAGRSTGLADALEKLTYASKRIPLPANTTTSHLFIVNPLSGGFLKSIFSTHPPIEKRIKRLRKLSSNR